MATCAEDALRDGWTDFLNRIPWDWFATLTFRNEVHPEAADKRFRLWISIANKELFGPRWSKKRKGIIWARALERQRRGVIHFHALLSGANPLRRLSYMDRWNELAGFAKIEPVRQDEAVRRYVSKYVVKGGEIDIGGPWKQFHDAPQLPFAALEPSRNGRIRQGGRGKRGSRDLGAHRSNEATF